MGFLNANTVGTGLSLAGGLYSAVQSRNAGIEQQNYYDRLAAAQDQQAYNMQIAGSQQLVEMQNQLRAVQSAGKVASAASGLVGDEAVALQNVSREKLDEMLLKQNLSSQVYNMNYEANQTREAGKNYLKAGRKEAVNTLISTAGQAANRWQEYKRYGGK